MSFRRCRRHRRRISEFIVSAPVYLFTPSFISSMIIVRIKSLQFTCDMRAIANAGQLNWPFDSIVL